METRQALGLETTVGTAMLRIGRMGHDEVLVPLTSGMTAGEYLRSQHIHVSSGMLITLDGVAATPDTVVEAGTTTLTITGPVANG